MATYLLAVLIFGSAAYVIYARIKKGKNCADCHTTCPVKKEQSEQ